MEKFREDQIYRAGMDFPRIAARRAGAAIMRGVRWIGSKIKAGWNWLGSKLGLRKSVSVKSPPVQAVPPEESGGYSQVAWNVAKGVGRGLAKGAELVAEYPRTAAALATAGLVGAAIYNPVAAGTLAYSGAKAVSKYGAGRLAKNIAGVFGVSEQTQDIARRVGESVGELAVVAPVETAKAAVKTTSAVIDAATDPYQASRDFQLEYMRSGPEHMSAYGVLKATLANIFTFGQAMTPQRAMDMARTRMEFEGYRP